MDRSELIDILLAEMNADTSSYLIFDVYGKHHHGIDDRLMYQSIADEFLERKWTIHKKDNKLSQMLTHEGRVMWESYGSYSSYLSSIQSKSRKKTILNNIKTVSDIGQKILMALLAVLTFALSYMKYQDDKTIDGLEGQVDRLTKEIEALQIPQFVVPSDSSTATETVKEKK